MNKEIRITIFFILVILGNLFVHFYNFPTQEITIVDEPAIIAATASYGSLHLENIPLLVKTNPYFGIIFFGISFIGSKGKFGELSNFKSDEEARNYFFKNPKIFYEAISRMRIMLVIAYLGSAFFLYFICRKFFSINASLLAVLLFTFSPLWSSLAKVLFFEIIELFFALIAIYLLLPDTNDFQIFHASFAFMFAVGSKLTAFFILPALLFLLYVSKMEKDEKLRAGLFLVGMSIVGFLTFFPQALHFSNTLFKSNEYAEIYFGFQPLQTLIGIIKPDAAMVLGIFIIFLAIRKLDLKWSKEWLFTPFAFMFWAFISIVVLSCFTGSVHGDPRIISRYTIFLTIPVFFYSAWAFDRLLNQRIFKQGN